MTSPESLTRKQRILRRLPKIGAWTLGILVVLFLILQYCLGGIVKGAATTVGPVVLGTDISISNLYTRIFSGKIDVDGLVVGAPEGFDANIFEMNDFEIDLDTASLLRSSEPIHIREIVIADPIVTYELKGIRSNLKALLRNLGADDDGNPSEEATQKGGRKVVIDSFRFTGGKVRVAVANGKGAVIPLPDIVLTDIGSKNGGVTGIEATIQIIKSITVGTVAAVADLVGDVGELAVDAVKEVGGLAVDAVKGAGDAAMGAVKGVGSAIGSLFGGGDDDTKASDESAKKSE